MAQPITITITIPHKLGKGEARARIAAGFERLRTQGAGAHLAQFQQAWAGDRLSFQAQALGQSFGGRIDAGETDVRIEIDLPALLAGLAEKISGKLRKEARLLLEKK